MLNSIIETGNDAIQAQKIADAVVVNGVTTIYSKIFSGFNRGIFNLFMNIAGTAPKVDLYFECSNGIYKEELESAIRLIKLTPNTFKADGLDLQYISDITGLWDNAEMTGTDYSAGGVTINNETGIITTVTAFPDGSYPFAKIEVLKIATSIKEAEKLLLAGKLVFFDSFDTSNLIANVTAAVTNKYLSMMPSIALFYRLRMEGVTGNGANTAVSIDLVSGINARTM